MWPKANNLGYPRDVALTAHLAAGSVIWRRLTAMEHRKWEFAWHHTYQRIFLHRGSFRHGAKAIDAYLREPVTRWLLVPFLSGVPGTKVHVVGVTASAFECEGPLMQLGQFLDIEFFISPLDLSWTFVRTHEDFALGGPYFARAGNTPVCI
jgi:hypothetical protein